MALVHNNVDEALLAHRATQELYRLGCKGHCELSCSTASTQGVGLSALMKIVERLMSFFTSFYSLEEDLQKREELRQANRQAPFMRLPPEIIFHVLAFLSAKDLALVQLASSGLAHYVCDEWLWKRLCERDYSPVKNALAGYFGKNWRWMFRSKTVIFKGRGQIRDGEIGTLITKDGRYEGEWKNGELNGYGFLVSSVGNIIEGQWKCRECFGLIVAHFLYSMLCLFGLVMLSSLAVFYTAEQETERLLLVLAVSCGIILTLSFLLRKQRLLIQALCAKKVPLVVADSEDPMVVELPSETPFDAPPSAPAMAVDQCNFAAPSYYPTYPGYPQDQQPIPMIVQTEMGNQVVYMYPVMPNPQFAPAAFPASGDNLPQQEEPPKQQQ